MPHLKLWDIKGLTHFRRGNAIRPGRGREMSRNARTRLKKRRVPICYRRWSKALQTWHLADGALLLDVPASPLASAMKAGARLPCQRAELTAHFPPSRIPLTLPQATNDRTTKAIA